VLGNGKAGRYLKVKYFYIFHYCELYVLLDLELVLEVYRVESRESHLFSFVDLESSFFQP
jgi:hypothetical protein